MPLTGIPMTIMVAFKIPFELRLEDLEYTVHPENKSV